MTDLDPGSPACADPTPTRSARWPLPAAADWSKLAISDRAVVVMAGLLSVFWLPSFVAAAVPRNALALVLGPIGLAALILQIARRRDPASLAATVCIAVVILASLFAVEPRAAFVGQLPEWNTAIAYVVAFAWWAIGREIDEGTRPFLLWSLTCGALLNGAIGVGQLLDAAEGELFFTSGRASGLMFNPVFYGTFMIGIGLVWTAMTCSDGVGRRWSAMVGLLVFLAALSGGRVVLGALVFGWVLCAMVWRSRVLVPAAAGIVGVLAAEVLMRSIGTADSSVERLAIGGSSGRVDAWLAALRGLQQRPVLGWGPANTELAVMRNFDLAAAQAQSAGAGPSVWWDPHNVLLLVLLSAGFVGALSLVVFLFFALRGDRHLPFLIGAAVMAITWMLEPVTVHTLPIVALLLGVSVRRTTVAQQLSAPEVEQSFVARGIPDRLAAVLVAVGVLAAMYPLAAAFLVDRAADNNQPGRAAAVAEWFGGDPWLEIYVANLYQRAFLLDPSDETALQSTVDHAKRASELYPTGQNLAALADASVEVGDLDGAVDALELAVDLEPWNPTVHYRLFLIAEHLGDTDAEATERAVLCEIGGRWCDLVAKTPASE